MVLPICSFICFAPVHEKCESVILNTQHEIISMAPKRDGLSFQSRMKMAKMEDTLLFLTSD